MAKKSKEGDSLGDKISFLKTFSTIIKEIGLTGFVVSVVVLIFLCWGTASQKEYFIDKFILFKNVDNDPFPFIFIVIILIAIIAIQSIYFSKVLKLRKEENKRIGEEKSKLQELLLDRKLHSSKSTKKIT